MKKCFIAVLMAVLTFASCSQREAYEPLNTVITASFEQDAAQTRLSVGTDNSLTWTEGDAFMMFGNGSSAKFSLTSGDGSANGTFSGVVPAEVKAAAYPWEGEYRPSLSENTLTMNLPALLDQTTIGKCNLPMYASVSSVQSISFKHLAGVMRIKFSNIPVGYNSLTVKASNPISGAFTADVNQSDPILKSSSTESDDKKITVTFTAATAEDNDKVLYIPLPVGTYEYITVTISGQDKEDMELITYTNRNVERAMVYTAGISYSDVNASTPSTEEALIAAIEKGGNVTLTSDITLTKPVIVTSDVTVNLNGYDIEAGIFAESNGNILEGITDSYVFWVKDGTLTINGDDNSEITAKSAKYSMAVWANGGNVVINGGKYVNSGDGCDLIYLSGTANVTVNGGVFEATQKVGEENGTNNVRSAINVKDDSYTAGTCKVSVQGGKFLEFDPANNVSEGANTNFVKAGYSSVAECGYYVVSEGIKNEKALRAAVAAGGKVTLDSDILLTEALTVTNVVTIDLNGYTIENKSAANTTKLGTVKDECIVFYVDGSSAKLTLNATNGGKVIATGDGSSTYYNVAVWTTNGAVTTINGGEYSNTADPNGDGCDLIYGRDGGKIYVNGGTFKAGAIRKTLGGGVYGVLNCKDSNGSLITVSGGKFYEYGPVEASKVGNGEVILLASNYYWSAKDSEGYYTVSTNIETEEALNAAIKAGGEVNLTSDITLTKPVIVTSDVTVNLNGYDIEAGIFAESNGNILEGTTDSYVFWVKGGTLTINGDDNSKITAQSAKYSMAVWANGGNVVINGGKYVNSGDGCDLIYLKGKSDVTINGGTFVATQKFGVEPGTNNARSAINVSDADYKNSNSKVFVKGGKFCQFNPADNVSEGNNTNFVVSGYSSVADGEYYVVSEGVKNEAALHAAVAAGGNIKLSSNINLASSISVTRDVTVDLNGHNLTCNSSDVFVVTAGTLTLNGNGVVWGSSDNSSSSCAVWAKENGKVIINGGTYKVGDDESGKPDNWRNDCIYARDNAQITINGGEYMYTGVNPIGHTFLLNLKDNQDASLEVKGGKFYKFNPAASNGENPVANFVAEGYSSVADGDYYIVSKNN